MENTLAPYRNRISSFELAEAKDIDDHPLNWRRHTSHQKNVMTEFFKKVGIAGATLAYRSERTGRLTAIDGHMRKDLLRHNETKVPVLILDVNDTEAEAIIMSYDRLGGMALESKQKFNDLVKSLRTNNLNSLVTALLGQEVNKVDNTPVYEIVPNYDEGYDAVMIFCKKDIEFAWLKTTLQLHHKEYANHAQLCHVLTFDEFKKLWESRS